MLDVVEGLAAETVKAASAQLWPLTDTTVTSTLHAVHRWEQSLAVLKIRLVREADARGIPAGEGHRSLTGWLRARLQLDPHPARELADQADALRWRPAVEQALIDGGLDLRQAMVIAAAVNAIPATIDAATTATDSDTDIDTGSDTVASTGSRTDADTSTGTDTPPADGATVSPADPASGSPAEPSTAEGSATDPAGTTNADPAGSTNADPAGTDYTTDAGSPDGARIMADAETVLIGMAAHFPAYRLRRLGERILAHVAPEVADRADEAALRRQEARAHTKRSFTLSLPVNGMVRLSGLLDVEAAAIVQAALQPLCVPTPGDDRTAGQRRADALVDVCRLALRTAELPEHGGEPPQVAVTIGFDTLTRQLGAAVLDNGERVSAATARRMACDARILPVVLGGAGQVLDAGRSRRLATGALRRALVARDRGCAFPSCDRPPRWCDAHHLRGWSRGGLTCLDNLVLLCRLHHRAVHDPGQGWRVRLGPDRLPQFIPPPWIDLLQRPRRNLYHPRT